MVADAKDRIRVNCDLRHVTTVLCCDPKAFTHTNPLDGMQEGGSFVWESDEEGEQAWERLPHWARKQIIEKTFASLRLPRLFDRERRRRIAATSRLRMTTRATHFSAHSSRVSPLLKDFGITPEQYREVVHKQYVKKFGKLGDAVVQSNMEVAMIQGFQNG